MLRRYLMVLVPGMLAAALLFTGLVLGQADPPERLFTVYQEIGEPYPQGLRYNPTFDQYAMIDTAGDLVLVDASTFAVQFTLYTAEANVNAYEYSHNGRWLAVALDRRIEIWDTQTGEMLVDFEPDGALAVQRPLYWSDADDLLAFESVVRAPQAIRRSENDTSILPWLWDVAAAKRERGSRLPGRVQALPFFDNRGGVVLGPQDTVIAAIAERLQVLKFDQTSIGMVSEVVTGRAELDPLAIWRSLDDQQLYIRNQRENTLVQVNTTTAQPVNLSVDRTLSLNSLDVLKDITLTKQSFLIGEPNTSRSNSLLEFLLGGDYLTNQYDYGPITVMLIDILQPVTVSPEQYGFLVYVRHESKGSGQLKFILPPVQNVVISPDEQQIMIRRLDGDQRIEVYDLHTGAFVRSYLPTVRDLTPNHVLAYNTAGDQIITDWQRIDVATGKTIIEKPYIIGFDSFYFSDDSQQIMTQRGNEWQMWDLATKQLLRRGTLELHGSVISVSSNGERYLSIMESGAGVEIYNIATGERRQRTFEQMTGRTLEDIVVSPDWRHIMVIYSQDFNKSYYSGKAVVLYSMDEGKLWEIMDDDLPVFSQYGWVDNEQFYISVDYFGIDIPTRTFGIEYDPSGLPACLVQAFPDDYPRWIDAWERFTSYLRVDSLNRLAQSVCAVLPGGDAAVEALFNPTPLPTREYMTPTPALVAGVPRCLTERFPNSALDYAADWRRITEGLTPAQVAELETLLCQNLTGEESSSGNYSQSSSSVLILDLKGKRTLGSYIPTRIRTRIDPLPLTAAFERVERRIFNSPTVSADGQYIAEFNYDGRVTVWRVNQPYEAFIDDVTATVEAIITQQNLIRVRPTETAPFEPMGTTAPTLTPTMTLTSPPLPVEGVEQPQRETVEVLPEAQLYTIDNPPAGWNPPGQLIIPPIKEYDFGAYLPSPTPTRIGRQPASTPVPTIEGATPIPTNTPAPATPVPTFDLYEVSRASQQYSNSMWWLSPVTGALTRDESLPRCHVSYDCQFSFNREWIWYDNGSQVILSRPDGSEARVLRDYSVHPDNDPYDYHWTGADTLEYTVNIYERDPNYPSTYTRRIIPGVSPDPEPTTYPQISINEQYTSVIAYQPGGGDITLVYTSSPTGTGYEEYKFYLYNLATGDYEFLLRDINFMENFWNPDGTQLFYRPVSPKPDAPWYVYDVASQTHREFGVFPVGEWSPDGRYILSWYRPDNQEINRLREAGEPLPKLSIYDMETGLTRHYYIPGTGYELLDSRWLWSPDMRYLMFQYTFPSQLSAEVALPHLLVLDTRTGDVVDLGFDVDFPVAWVEGD